MQCAMAARTSHSSHYAACDGGAYVAQLTLCSVGGGAYVAQLTRCSSSSPPHARHPAPCPARQFRILRRRIEQRINDSGRTSMSAADILPAPGGQKIDQ